MSEEKYSKGVVKNPILEIQSSKVGLKDLFRFSDEAKTIVVDSTIGEITISKGGVKDGQELSQ